MLAPEAHRRGVQVAGRRLSLQVGVHHVPQAVPAKGPHSLWDAFQLPGPHRSPALLQTPQRAGEAHRRGTGAVVLQDRPHVAVIACVHGEHGVVAGGARHVLSRRHVRGNPHHPVHVLFRNLPLHPVTGVLAQAMEFRGPSEVGGQEVQVIRIPRQGGGPPTHHCPTTDRRVLAAVLPLGPARIGVVLDLPATRITRLDRVPGHVVGIIEPLLVRLHNHLLNLFRRSARLDLLARALLSRHHQLAAHLVAQQGTNRLFPTNLNVAAFGQVAGVGQALELVAR